MKKVLKSFFVLFTSFIFVFATCSFALDPGSTKSSNTSSSSTSGGGKDDSDICEGGVKLNTYVPYVGRCIQKVDSETSEATDSDGVTKVTTQNAFPVLMSGMTKIVITIIVVVSFLLVVAGGVMYSMAGLDDHMRSTGKSLIMKVIAGIILLGMSGIILHLINPNFFTAG